jgi:hypothetical protein
MKFIPTGKFASVEQQKAVNDSFQLDYCTPIMAVLPGGNVATASEDFRDMAKRFAMEAGLPDAVYAIDPITREFHIITEDI